MKLTNLIALSAALFAAAPALAQAQTTEISRRATIFSAEGTKLGRVENVVKAEDGSTAAVKIIYRGKFLTIPAASLAAGEKGLTTSLTNAEIRKM